jgi:hypothetical protein
MAIHHYEPGFAVQILQMHGDGVHGNQFGALDPADSVLARFAAIDQTQPGARIQPRFHFRRRDFKWKIRHVASVTARSPTPSECPNGTPLAPDILGS